ncbi:hypothetical protein Tco_0454659 [Tanacetum coccineum]
MRQEQAQQAARDEKLVPTEDRVKIGKSNLRMDPTLTQKEETYQVMLDIIKNTPCYNAFLTSADVHVIYMHQFWFTIKRVNKSTFYQFHIDNKTCQIDVELFRDILWICPRVQNQQFTVPPSNDSLFEFLLDLGYKGQLKHISEMYVDHMHQPWRTFGAIINRCLSGKTSSNDRLRPLRIEILWGINHKANVDYAALIWEDLQYQIDYQQSKTFIGISTSLIPPKKGRGKGSQGTKVVGILKKATSASKKKKQNKNVSIRDESSDEESEEHEERLVRKPRAGLRPEVLDEPTGDSTDSDEGAGTSPEVPDEIKDKSEAQYNLEDWGSTDDETFLFNDKEEKPEDISWVSTDDDDFEIDDEEDDASIDIEKTDDERTDTDVEDQLKGVAEINIAEEAEEENTERVEEQKDDEELKADEKQKGDDQARDKQVVVPVSTTQKETPNLLQSTSSHCVPSNFGNQFINSPNASLIGTIPENAEVEINSLLDIQIQQDVPNTQQEPFHAVKVLPYAFKKVLQSHTEELKKELFEKRNYKDVIEESVQANVFNEVNKFLPKFLPQAVKEALEKTPSSLELYDALTWLMLLDEATAKGGDNSDRVLKKRDRGDDQDEDPSAGPNQGMKNRRTRKDDEPSKKTSTTKESSKVKTIDDTPEQSWFNEMVQVEKPPLTFDEIHKFCDGTLQSVHKILHERLLNFKFKDIPLREWTTKDKKRTGIMVNKIDD